MIPYALISTRAGGEEPAGAVGFCNILVLPAVPSVRHGSCGPRGSTVRPGMCSLYLIDLLLWQGN